MLGKFTKLIQENQEKKFNAIKSFYLKDELNPDVWENDAIKAKISKQLIKIAEDFIESINTDSISFEIEDIILTGSNCNYNWSLYSDFDIHILIDFNKIDSDDEITRAMFHNAAKLWERIHNIEVEGYNVELYVQSTDEEHVSSGQYSLLNNEWIIKPTKVDFTPDEKLIERKATQIMDVIDEIEEQFENAQPIFKIDESIKVIWKKIKDARKSGLSEEGEYSIENLVFKLLRRNGYIEKLIDIRTKNYDKQFK